MVFTSYFWKELFKMMGVSLDMISAYHPQSDGQTERVNQCVETYLRCDTRSTQIKRDPITLVVCQQTRADECTLRNECRADKNYTLRYKILADNSNNSCARLGEQMSTAQTKAAQKNAAQMFKTPHHTARSKPFGRADKCRADECRTNVQNTPPYGSLKPVWPIR
ncbi:Unknown protein [Striga hermonthica]|uniref:Integrase catalytic domain-containing protein n=1 Tax=Striga hermonthica TaxID=68872 RepID=A0A9N7R8R5_STRHE|nr:Unknown protein [Striga hermonthica]